MKLDKEIIDGRYKIIEQIGKGGMSIVYKAISINLNKVWAIKQIKLDSNSPIDFLAEPSLLKDLDHSALPRIVDIIYEEDKLFIVLDYIDGTSLDTFLAQSITLTEEKVVSWAKDLCDVLNYLHTQDYPIIYRDMKPSNIMLTKQGNIKLIDFGIARQYKEDNRADTVIMGTRGYAAPEQYGNGQTDARTDIYSLGVTLYHLVTGKGPNDPPFELKPIRQLNANLSEGLEHIILKCTKQNPKDRYQSIKELLYDLDNIEKLSESYILKKRRARGKYFIMSFALSTVVMLSGSVLIWNAEKNDYLANVKKAELYAEENDIDTAMEILNDSIKDMPKRSEAYLEEAKIYLNNAQYSKAITFLTIEAIEKNKSLKDEDEYYYLLGMACFNKSDYKGAKDNFSNIKKSNFKGLEYYKAIAEVFSNPNTISEDDSVVETINNLKSYLDKLENESEQSNGYLILADIYRYNPKIFTNADDIQIDLLEQAKNIDGSQSNVAIYDRLGQAYYLKSLSLKNNDEENSKYLNLALENYSIVLRLGYNSSNTYKNIGVIYKNLKDYDKAKNYFEILIRDYPTDFKGYLELSKLCNEVEGNKPEAERDYTDFIKYYKLAEENNTIDNNFELEKMKIVYNEVINRTKK